METALVEITQVWDKYSAILFSSWNSKNPTITIALAGCAILAFLTKDDVGYRRKEVSSMSVESPASPNYTNRVTSSNMAATFA